MKKLTIMTIMSAAVLMSSCGLYQKYERPELSSENTSDIMRDAAQYANTTDTTTFGDVAWQEVFTDPQLQALIKQGLEKNVDLANATLNVKIAEAQLQTARLAFLPSVVFTPDASYATGLSGSYKDVSASKYNMPVTASWNVDLFGNLVAKNRSEKVALLASQDYQQAARSRMICGIANSYFTLLMLDRQLEILNETEGITKQTWEMMKLQKELHGARETAVVSAEAAYLKVQSQKIDTERQIHEMENTLSLLVGQQAQTISRGKLENQNLPENFSTGLGIHLMANRPDIHAAEMELAKCFYGVEQARSSFYPGLKITATGSFANSFGALVANPGQFLANFAASLTQPIFSNGKLVAGLKVAKAQYEKAYNNWEHSILAAGAEVSDALVKYNSSKKMAEVDEQRVEVLKKNVEYNHELFKMGKSTYLEVLTAESNLLNAETNQVTDNFNKMQAVVNLYSALGGGRK